MERRVFGAAALALMLSGHVLAQDRGTRGLDPRSYQALQRGMTEGELLAIAGPPDVIAEQGMVSQGMLKRGYIYLPTSRTPHTTTITLVGGRVTAIERQQKA